MPSMSPNPQGEPIKVMRPRVGTIIGDPSGIGPEVTAKAWATGEVHQSSRPILIGSIEAMRHAVEVAGLDLEVRQAESPEDIADSPEILDVIDNGSLDWSEIRFGEDTRAAGRATGSWLSQADQFARDGQLDATIMGPVSAEALDLAGELDKAVRITPGETYLLLITGPLRVMHVTDHIPLRQVCEILSPDLVFDAIERLQDSLRKWGLDKPRIAVAGLNAHAKGEEDQTQILPGVERARAKGLNVTGPISPDAIFRQCIDGKYDAVLAMYHDQGHIAVKTWGFSGNCVVVIGLPYLHLSVAHGTAYDIVGKGIADHSMILQAMKTAGEFSSGTGLATQGR